jgi:hypothetical protein
MVKRQDSLEKIDKWVEITVPYLDRNNDYIQIYLKKDGEGYLLTDGGGVITGLKQEGYFIDTPEQQKLLQITLNGYGIIENNGSLQVKATPDNFALCKHFLLQAILAVNHMFYLLNDATS